MNCPKCTTNNFVKAGNVKGKQRYLCKNCRYFYTVEHRGKSPELRRAALQLYLEGLGFRSIGRILKVSNVAVLNWVREYGQKLERIKKEEGTIKVVEIDELHTYILGKKTIAGFGWLLIGFGRESSISCLVVEALRQGLSFGRNSKIVR